MIFLCAARPTAPSSSSSSACPVQLTVPMGDDGQLMSCGSCGSCGPPDLWLSTHAVGDDSPQMCGPPPVLCFSTHADHFLSPTACSFPFFFVFPLIRSSNFSARFLFLIFAVCTLEKALFELKIGFYVKFPP